MAPQIKFNIPRDLKAEFLEDWDSVERNFAHLKQLMSVCEDEIMYKWYERQFDVVFSKFTKRWKEFTIFERI